MQGSPTNGSCCGRNLRGISVLEEFNLAYDILIYPRHLSVAAEPTPVSPPAFRVDHPAKPPIKSGSHSPGSGIRDLAVSNISCKLSGLVTEADWRQWQPEH